MRRLLDLKYMATEGEKAETEEQEKRKGKGKEKETMPSRPGDTRTGPQPSTSRQPMSWLEEITELDLAQSAPQEFMPYGEEDTLALTLPHQSLLRLEPWLEELLANEPAPSIPEQFSPWLQGEIQSIPRESTPWIGQGRATTHEPSLPVGHSQLGSWEQRSQGYDAAMSYPTAGPSREVQQEDWQEWQPSGNVPVYFRDLNQETYASQRQPGGSIVYYEGFERTPSPVRESNPFEIAHPDLDYIGNLESLLSVTNANYLGSQSWC